MSTYYREVRRKAAVGERIRIVNPIMASGYDEGDGGAVIKSEYGECGVLALINEKRRGIFHSEYVVLEPVAQSSIFPEDFVKFVQENADGIRKLIDEIEKEAV